MSSGVCMTESTGKEKSDKFDDIHVLLLVALNVTKKVVDGNLGDKDKKFDFTVVLYQ